jgi:hypothetical protein
MAAVPSNGLPGFSGGAFAGERLFDASGSFQVGWSQIIQQPIRAGFQKLRQTDKGAEANWIAPALDMADGFPMHTNQFRQAFLRHVSAQPRLADALADEPQNLFVRHGS